VGKCGADPVNGKVRDVRTYDYELSAEQIASICANTSVAPPNELWYKFDATSGVTDESTADLGAANATFLPDANYVNGTLDLDGTLTIATNGTLSAPRGRLETSVAIDFNGTFTHNNGTWVPNGSSNTENLCGNKVFYNVQNEASAQVRFLEGYTIENSHSNNGGSGFNYIHNEGTYLYGTTSSAATLSVNLRCLLGTDDATRFAIVKGVSNLYPVVFSFWNDLAHNRNVQTGNMKVTNTVDSMMKTGDTVQFIGDMEFTNAVTVDSGDTLDLNGQRAEFGNFSLTGTLSDTANGALAYFKGTYTRSGGHSDLTNTITTFIAEGGGTSDYYNPVPRRLFVNTDSTITFNNPLNEASAGSSDYILGAGTVNANNQNINGKNQIVLATGGTHQAGSSTIKCKEDFTTSGGLIGKSALNANDTHCAYGTATSYASSNIQSITMSGWVKMNSDFASQETYQSVMRQNDNLLMVRSNGSVYVGVELSKADNVSFSYPGATSATGLVTAGRWHHVAMTWKASEGLKAYLDGKLVAHTNDATTGGDFVKLRRRDGTTATVGGRDGTPIVSQLAGTIAQTARWQNTDTSACKTASQIRTEMFQKASELSSTTGLYLWFQFDEGTGTTAEDLSPNGTDFTVGTLAKSAEASWAGAGTFTRGTSTIDMTGNGTVGIAGGVTSFHNLKVAASGKTTTLSVLAGSSDIRFHGTLTHGGGTANSSGNPSWTMKGSSTVSVGSDWDNWYLCYWESSAPVPAATWRYWLALTDSTLAGDMTCNGYIRPHQSVVNSGDYTITAYNYISSNGGGLNMGAGSLILTHAQGVSSTTSSSVFTAGPGATITGIASKSTFMSQNNFVIVGKVENLNVTNEELSVTGQVINCTGEIHQQFPTIDHDQQLDFDTADDRDIILGRDLDKNTELINS
jgi:hypothetical protein